MPPPTAVAPDSTIGLTPTPGGGAPPTPVDEPGQQSSLPDEADIPATVAHFRVEREIGRGGVGAVLKAHDDELNRDVAVKVLLAAHRGNPDVTARFLEEAQISAQMQHPGVVPVYETGLRDSERPYFAMKLVDGKTLAQLLKARSFLGENRHELLRVFEQVCQTMAYAHSRGVIHRDLKPSNIMVGAFGEVQVMDWGLAKVLGAPPAPPEARAETPAGGEVVRTVRATDDASKSSAGQLLGTPAYIAPEQARGELDAVDERADIFGLGAILCEILTGAPPYTGDTVETICRKATTGAIDDALARLDRSRADRQLVALAKLCLSRDRVWRPRNAGILASQVVAHRESIEEHARTLEVKAAHSRARFLVTLTVLVALVLLGVVFLVIGETRKKATARLGSEAQAVLRSASDLLGRARLASAADTAPLYAALREAGTAVKLAEMLPGDPVLREARSLEAAIRREIDDRTLLAQLEELRQDRSAIFDALSASAGSPATLSVVNEDVRSFFDEIDDRMRAAFVGYGIDVETMEPAAAAEAIRARAIARELAQALDQWAMLLRFDPRADEARIARLFDIAQRADDTPWRTRLRAARDVKTASELSALLKDAPLDTSPPSTFDLLAFGFRWLNAPDQEEAVLRRGAALHPGDFWINARLARALLDRAQWSEAMRYLTASIALRPGSGYAHHLMGLVLIDGYGDIAGATAEFRADIAVSPAAPRSYYRISAILAGEQSAAITAGDLDGLRVTLQHILDSGARYNADGFVRLRAQICHLRGDTTQAILTLEESMRVPGAQLGSFVPFGQAEVSHAHLLEYYRSLLLPDLVSYASIDAAIAPYAANGARDTRALSARFDMFRQGAERKGAFLRIAYLDARMLQIAGRNAEAAGAYAQIIAKDRTFPEPCYRLAQAQRAAGDSSSAAATLRGAIEQDGFGYADIWNMYLETAFVDLQRTPVDFFSSIGAFAKKAAETAHGTVFRLPLTYEQDIQWLLARLASNAPVRINCGGDDYRAADGALWGHDRFFTLGGTRYLYGRAHAAHQIEKTDEDPLYQSERWFARGGAALPGYHIPLPPGRYRVTLHFAEVFYRAQGKQPADVRSFDVRLQGTTVLPNYSPLAAGFAVADLRTFDTEVKDGMLAIEFVHKVENPKISALEIVRL